MVDQLVVGLIPFSRHFRHHAIDDIRGLVADIGSEGLEADRAAFELFQSHEGCIVCLVGRTTRHGVEKRATKAVNVAAKILGQLIEFFWRDIVRSAPNLRRRSSGVVRHHSQAEIHQLYRATVGKKDVRGLDVAMDEVQFHRRLQALRDLDSHLEGSDFWNHSAFLHEVVERTATDEFHGDVKLGTGFAEIKNSNHIRVVDLSSRARLVSQLLRFIMLVATLNL